MAAGYSGTPLAKKLGLKPGSVILARNAPAHYEQLLAPLPGNVCFATAMSERVDVVHLFAPSRREADLLLSTTLPKLRPDAAIWMSWPKRSSGVATDMTEDTVRELALPRGLVDIKVCAVDETWSGLKLVVRVENRPPKSPTTRRAS